MAEGYDAPKITATDNWAAKGHQGIYDMLQSSVQPARITETGQEFSDCGKKVTQAFEDLSRELSRVLDGQWSGEAATKGVQSSQQLVDWGKTLGAAASKVGGGMQRAGSTAGSVKSSVDKPKDFNWTSVLLPSILPGGAIIGAIDAKNQVDGMKADEAAAIRVMSSVYSPDYASVDSTVPAFLPAIDPTQPQPEQPPTDPGRPGPGQPWVPPGGRTPRDPRDPGSVDPGRTGGIPRQDPPQGGERPIERPVEQPRPSDQVRPGEHPRWPIDDTGLSGDPMPVERPVAGPVNAPGQNVGQGGVGQGGTGGGYLGGFAAGGAAGGGAGAGGLGRGGSAGVGMGGVSAPVSGGGAGRPGAPGAPGGLAPGGAAGRGEEDKEHETAEYLVNEDNLNDLIGDLGRVSPPVIGE
ncbi:MULTISPECIES: WXG100 family type VII secretion target [unclassified Crossiella]|uniref:WXG100 family type VII secretion target n=1 Tax=unclassified Crossiella TaxID=2620835 RepID=UPI001FFF5A19|nr:MULTISPECIES: hypothetical protein [unclassified Crossiella]MCK2240515.1 hypothetical protein [Crossiella sp. S99.2]MCK2253034.1 hypothetical protein [Crossiella sp. S99.1]